MDSRSRIVHVVNSYIKENLSKDLSMVVLGDYVGLNPAYLSRIYKETAGQSINSYISDQRTVLAKKLLKDPTIKIQKIAEIILRNMWELVHRNIEISKDDEY